MTPKSPPIVRKSSKSQAFSEPGPADCAKRLQSARPLCLQRGAWGVWDRKLESCLFLTPLKVSPVAPRNPLYPSSSAPLWSPFFSVPYGAHKLSKNYHILHPTSSKNDTQIWEKVLSKPVRKTLAKNNTFLRVSGTPDT